jgi:hypothetical protein
MTAQDIIAQIVKMHKDHSFEDVQELIVSRACIGDLAFIRDELSCHVSSNETNASDDAIRVINCIIS